jgi:hypothetical protein
MRSSVQRRRSLQRTLVGSSCYGRLPNDSNHPFFLVSGVPVLGSSFGPKPSDVKCDLGGVWLADGLAAAQSQDMGPKSGSPKWVVKVGLKNGSKKRPKNGTQKWDPKVAPKNGPQSGSVFKFSTGPVFGVHF